MAPELIQGKQYDAKADIWSFGITALELSQGRPPRSRESPQRVLLRTWVISPPFLLAKPLTLGGNSIQDDPPTLDREGGTYKYSRAFKEVIEWCLNKDPAKRCALFCINFFTMLKNPRPTAEELLQASFFKGAKKKSYLINTILSQFPFFSMSAYSLNLHWCSRGPPPAHTTSRTTTTPSCQIGEFHRVMGFRNHRSLLTDRLAAALLQ